MTLDKILAMKPGRSKWDYLMEEATELLTLAYTERYDHYIDRTESWKDSDACCAFYDNNASLLKIIYALGIVLDTVPDTGPDASPDAGPDAGPDAAPNAAHEEESAEELAEYLRWAAANSYARRSMSDY